MNPVLSVCFVIEYYSVMAASGILRRASLILAQIPKQTEADPKRLEADSKQTHSRPETDPKQTRSSLEAYPKQTIIKQ